MPGRCAGLVVLVAAMIVAEAAAVERFWDGISSGGDVDPSGIFDVGGNWSGGAFPAGGDIATFDLNDTFTVTFDSDEVSDELRVFDGDVTFVSDSATRRTYKLSTGAADANVSGGSLQIGAAGTPVYVTLPNETTGGGVNVSVMNIGSGSDGTVVVSGNGSQLDVMGATNHDIGLGGAQGTLTVSDDGLANYGVNGTLNVGDSANGATRGNVTVQTGGMLNTGQLDIATSTSSAIGIVTVDGAGSVISQTLNNASLTIGSSVGGAGTLNVIDGGTFNTGTGAVLVRSTGVVNVIGGTLNLRGGWSVAAPTNLNFEDGIFDVQGSGILMTNFDFEYGDTTGSPEIRVAGAGRLLYGQDFTLAPDAGMTAQLTVGGVDGTDRSTVRSTSFATTLEIGVAGNAVATVESGGYIDTGGTVVLARDPGSSGQLTVGGSEGGIASELHVGTALRLGVDASDSSGGEAMVTIDDEGVATVSGLTWIDADDLLEVNSGGLFTAGDEVVVDGGMLIENGGGLVDLAATEQLVVRNGGTINLGSSAVNIPSGAIYQVESGSLLATGGSITLGDGPGPGSALTVLGAGSSVSPGGTTTIARDGGGAIAEFSDESETFLNTLIVAGGDVDGTSGTLILDRGGLVHVFDSIEIATGSGNNVGEIHIQTDGSHLDQSSGTSLTIGHATMGSVEVTISDTGILSTGTGGVTINASALVQLESGGILNANSDVFIDGGSLSVINSDVSQFNLLADGTLTVENGGGVEFDLNYAIDRGATFDFSGGSSLTVGGELQIGGDGSDAFLMITGLDSSLEVVGASQWGPANGDALVTIDNGATASLGIIHLADSMDADAQATLLVSDGLDGGATVTADDIFIATQIAEGTFGELGVTGPGTTLSQNGAATLTVGGSSVGTSIGSILVGHGGTFETGTGAILVDETGEIELVQSSAGVGTFNANGPMTLRGDLNVRFLGGEPTDGGGTFTADDQLTVEGGSVLLGTLGVIHAQSVAVNSGGSIENEGGEIHIADEFMLGEASVEVTGDSMFNVGGVSTWAATSGAAHVTVSNFATATVADVHLANTLDVDAVAMFDVFANAVVTTGSIFVADQANEGSLGSIGVIGNASLMQDGAATLTVGHETEGTARIIVASGGTFDTGTGAVDIHETGQLFVTHNNDVRGTFNANGPMTVRGTVEVQQLIADLPPFGGGTLNANDILTVESGSILLGIDGVINAGVVGVTTSGTIDINGGEMHVADELTIDDAAVHLSQTGVLDAEEITPTNGGTLNFTGGTLHVGTFNGDLTNEGGTLAPGSSIGNTLVLGEFTQEAGVLEFELGGTAPGSEHDLLSVTGNVVLMAGELHLLLLDEFTPDPSDTFTVLNSNNLFGFFDNIETGDRLETLDGRGSFLVHYGAGSEFATNEIRLTEFMATVTESVAGDYNQDGIVNAADYIVWRNHEGTEFDLPNRDPEAMGNIDQADYQFWVENFGNTSGSGSSIPHSAFRIPNSSAVPEPSGIILAAIALVSRLFGGTGLRLRYNRSRMSGCAV
jgi:hypothetical protein